jgi:PRTRC genetic system protein A
MIPTFFKDAGFAEPAAPLYYLVAGNGLFLVRRTGLFTSISRASGVAGLEEQKPELVLRFGKIPRAMMERIYGFLKWAWREWESEAILFLYYSPETGKFLLDAPPQTIFLYRRMGRWNAEGRVAYRTLARPESYVKLGDVHSHGDLPAFFSAQDDRDDLEEGLKIVMGRMDRERPEVEVSFVAAQRRFPLRPEDVLEGFSAAVPPPRQWIERVQCEYEG